VEKNEKCQDPSGGGFFGLTLYNKNTKKLKTLKTLKSNKNKKCKVRVSCIYEMGYFAPELCDVKINSRNVTKSKSFYRAMHFRAKRGIAIACRLSVCPSLCLSVTLVDCDHIGWNSSEIISPLVSLGCFLSADPNIRGLLQGEHPEIWAQSDLLPVDLSVGDIRSQIAAEWIISYSATVTMDSL